MLRERWHFCRDGRVLLGSRALRERHLGLMGYQLLPVRPRPQPHPLPPRPASPPPPRPRSRHAPTLTGLPAPQPTRMTNSVLRPAATL